MAREARHFVDEAFFVIFGKYLAEFSKKLLNFVPQFFLTNLGALNTNLGSVSAGTAVSTDF